MATCTEHNSYVRCPGIFQETSRKHPGGPGVGAPGDEDVCTGRAREGAHDAGGLAAGWYYLARSLTAASIATAPSGLEFETRDGSHSGAVATGRHGLDGAWTGRLCSLPELPCAWLLLRALPQGSNQLTFLHPVAHSSPTLAVISALGDGIWPRHWAGRKCPLQVPCRSDSEALP